MVHSRCRAHACFARLAGAVFLLQPIFGALEYVEPTGDVVYNWLPNNPEIPDSYAALEYVEPTGDVIYNWLPNNPENPDAYAGYCAHPPIQETTVSTPLSEHELSLLGNAELVGLQVIFRHGVRIPTSPLEHCFNVPNYSMEFDCGIRRVWQEVGLGVETSLELEDVYPKIFGRCGTGRLQDEAKYQFQEFARTLKEKYDFEKLGITSQHILLRADEEPRTQASMYLLVSHLFPDARVQNLHLMPQDVDPWTGNPNCPEMLKARSALEQTASLPIIPGDPDNHDSVMAQLWADVTGLNYHPIKAKDCLMQAVCTPQPLPPGFTKELFDWAMYKSLKAQQMKYASKPVVSKVLGSPVLFDMEDMFHAQTKKHRDQSTPILALYSTHDTTIIQLLVTLDLWDGQWPMYAEALILEAYQAVTSSGKVQASFRLLRRGKPLAIPACGGETICPAEVLAGLGMPSLRNPSTMNTYCQVPPPLTHYIELSSTGDTEPIERSRLLQDVRAYLSRFVTFTDSRSQEAVNVQLSYASLLAIMGVVVISSALLGFLSARWCAHCRTVACQTVTVSYLDYAVKS